MSEKLPPLSIDAYGKVIAIEGFATQAALACVGLSGVDRAKTIRALRTCASEMFTVYLEYYSAIGYTVPDVLQKIQAEISATISETFRIVLPPDVAGREVGDIVTQKVRIAQEWNAKKIAAAVVVAIEPSSEATLIAHIERIASTMGIKQFCGKVGISVASYHNVRSGRGGKKVRMKVEEFLASLSDPKTSKKL